MPEGLIVAIYWLSLNIYHEARNQPFEGKVAVAHVTMNRVRIKHVTVEETVKKPWAFSWMNSNDPQKYLPIDIDAGLLATMAAWQCADDIMQGKDRWGATHYYNPSHADPVWAHMPEEYPVVGKIGDHIFLKGAF